LKDIGHPCAYDPPSFCIRPDVFLAGCGSKTGHKRAFSEQRHPGVGAVDDRAPDNGIPQLSAQEI